MTLRTNLVALADAMGAEADEAAGWSSYVEAANLRRASERIREAVGPAIPSPSPWLPAGRFEPPQ